MQKVIIPILSSLSMLGCANNDEPVADTPPAPLPDINVAVFSNPTVISNPYYGPNAGQILVYEGGEIGMDPEEEIRIERLTQTREVMGITAIVQNDLVWADGVLVEDTDDWLAQDDNGNLWYLGEFVENYDDNGGFVDNEGSWEAGVESAQPGYWLPANPQSGDRYMQEYWPKEAEDYAEVEGFQTVTIDLGTYDNCLVTRDINPSEQGVYELKFYAPGIGLIKEEKYEQDQLVEVVELIEILNRSD